jgi:alpha-1,6-mannosyltransferase
MSGAGMMARVAPQSGTPNDWLPRPKWVDVQVAWRTPAVRRGLLGTLLIALGGLSPAYLPRNIPWWGILVALRVTGTWGKVIGSVVTVVGLLLLVDAWFRLRPRAGHAQPQAYRHVKHWAVLVLWSLPFLIAPPIFSQDAYSYAAQGWLVHNHINPYTAGPGVLPGAYADQVSWVWRYTLTPYGPLSIQIAHVLVDASGFQPYLSAVLMRIPALAGVVLIVILVPRLARAMGTDPEFAAWFATLNPLLVIDFVGGMHNDALMMGLVLLGVWIATWDRRNPRSYWWLVGAAAIGVGAAIKQPAFLAAYAVPLIGRPWRDFSRREIGITLGRVLASFLVSVGVFAGISVATGLGFGWLNAVSVPGMAATLAPSTIVGEIVQFFLNLAGLDPSGRVAITAAHGLFLAAGGVMIFLLAITVARRRPITFLSYGYLSAAFFGPAMHSWYMLWSGLLLPHTRPTARVVRIAIWTTVVLLSYDAILVAWRNNAAAVAWAATGGFWWLAHAHQSRIEVPAAPIYRAAHLQIVRS